MELEDFNKNLLRLHIYEMILTLTLKIETGNNISNFYNIHTSNLFIPHITHSTRITNFIQGISGNFTFSISEHLPQFLNSREDNQPLKNTIYK